MRGQQPGPHRQLAGDVAGHQPLQEAAHVLARQSDDGPVGKGGRAHGVQLGSRRGNANADHPPPRRLARPFARWRDAQSRRPVHRPAVRPSHHHAQPVAAGDQSRGGGRVPRPDHRRGAARLHAADDLLSDRRGRRRGARARPCGRRLGRGQALPGGRDDQLGERGDRRPQPPPRARADAGDRHAAARPRRGHRPAKSTCSTARRCSSNGCWSR